MSTKKSIPDNLTWPQFRAYYAKYGNKKKNVSEAWKEYKNKEEEDTPLVIEQKKGKRSAVKTRVSPSKKVKSILKTNKISVTKKKVQHNKGNTPPSENKEGYSLVMYEVRDQLGYTKYSLSEIVRKLAGYFNLGKENSSLFLPRANINSTKTKTKNTYTFANGKITTYSSPKKIRIVEIYYRDISASELKKISKILQKLESGDNVYKFKRIENTDIELISPEKRPTVRGRLPSIIAEVNLVERGGKEKRTTISETIFGYLKENILEHAKEVQEEESETYPVTPVRVEYIDNKHIKVYINYNYPIEGAAAVLTKLQQFFEYPYSIKGKKYKVVVLTTKNREKYF